MDPREEELTHQLPQKLLLSLILVTKELLISRDFCEHFFFAGLQFRNFFKSWKLVTKRYLLTIRFKGKNYVMYFAGRKTLWSDQHVHFILKKLSC